MQAKPAFLGPDVSSAFQEASVVAAYQQRPPYPAETFDELLALMGARPWRVLDAGCGTGFVARPLAERVDHVDAVDCSAAMIEEGKRLPGGANERLRWIVAPVEQAPLAPPYALITTGDSLHWLEWASIMPRFGALLQPDGWLAVLSVEQVPPPWLDELLPVIVQYSTVHKYQSLDVVTEVERRGLFTRGGERWTEPVPFAQSLDDYVASFHGRASFSRERMEPAALAAFDAEVRTHVARYAPETVTLQICARITWGRPHGAGGSA